MDLMEEERRCYLKGIQFIAGVDEVGRGCLAGPVYAAAVILPKKFRLPGLNDSKKLKPALREDLYEKIKMQAVAYHVAWIDVEIIDRINIFQASMKAMTKALQGLLTKPDHVLVDGSFPLPVPISQSPLVNGDGRSASVAAASIMAKVSRDRFMSRQEKIYPKFSFSRHKGYGTPGHLEELKKFGATPLHRRTFAPVQTSLAALSLKA